MVRTIPDRATIADAITEALDRGDTADHVIAWLSNEHGARHRFAHGTYELRLAGLTSTCTAGSNGLLRAWVRKARAA